MRTAALLSIVVTLLGGVASLGCSRSTRSVFRPSDPAFTPRAGAIPTVYLRRNIEDVPKQGMRSVGLIEVTVPTGSGIDGAMEAAAKKGSELGCWILIEHAAFAEMQSRASLDHGATVILAHGAGPHIGRPPSPGQRMEFDCVVQTNSVRAAFQG